MSVLNPTVGLSPFRFWFDELTFSLDRHKFNTSSHEWERVQLPFTKIKDCLGSARHCEAVTEMEKSIAAQKAREDAASTRQKGMRRPGR